MGFFVHPVWCVYYKRGEVGVTGARPFLGFVQLPVGASEETRKGDGRVHLRVPQLRRRVEREAALRRPGGVGRFDFRPPAAARPGGARG